MNLLQDTKVSLFQSVKTDFNPDQLSVEDAIGANHSYYKTKVEYVRAAIADEGEYRKRKADTLPAITWSGVFEGGHKLKNLRHYNTLLCVDFDKFNDKGVDLTITKNILQGDPHVQAIFVSPSNDGLKVIVPLSAPPEESTWNEQLKSDAEPVLVKVDEYHKAQFEGAKNYFSQSYGLLADDSGKDVCRLCFVSADPDLYINPTKATPLPMVEVQTSPITPQLFPRSAETIAENTVADDDADEDEDTKEKDDKVTTHKAEWLLKIVPADEYQTWLKVGLSLFNHFGGAEKAFKVFVRWSQKSGKFKNEDECRKLVWDYARNGTEKKLTIGYIRYLHTRYAKELVYQPILQDSDRKHEIYSVILSEAKTQGYLLKVVDGWKSIGKKDVKEHLKRYFEKLGVTPRADVTNHIIDHLRLITDRYVRMSCFEAGVREIQNRFYLVEQTAPIIKPVQGSWTIIRKLFFESLGEKDREHLFSRIKVDLQGYLGRNPNSLGQANIFLGEKDTGKSTAGSKVYAPLLGGIASGNSVIIGKSNFNKQSLEYAVTGCDDSLKRPPGMTDTDTREHLAQIIKCFTVQSPNEFEGKFKDSVTVNEWFRRLYFTLNTNDSLLKLLPAPDGDVSDKYNIYLFQKDFSKEGLGSDAEISNELPAFAYFLLNEWEIPSWIERSARLGIVSYHNPEATKMIWESSSESGLWQYIVNIMVVNKTERYHGTSQQIFLQISSDLQNTKLSRKVWEGIKVERFGYLLRSIKRQAGEFVERSAGNDPATWTIVCPQALPPKTWIDDKLEKMRGETF